MPVPLLAGTLEQNAVAKIGETACKETLFISTTSLRCTANFGQSLAVGAVVELGSVSGTGAAFFTFDAPTLSHFASINSPTTGAGVIQVRPPSRLIGIGPAVQRTAATRRAGVRHELRVGPESDHPRRRDHLRN